MTREIYELELTIDIEAFPMPLTSATVTPTAEAQTIEPPEGYDGFYRVTVEPIPDDYVIPEGTLYITAPGTYDVTEYEYAFVDVDTGITLKKYMEEGYDAILETSVTTLRVDFFRDDLQLRSITMTALAYIIDGLQPFAGCDNLETVYLPVLTAVPASCFAYSGAREIKLDNVGSIGELAFANSNLKRLDLTSLSSMSVPTLANANAFSGTPIASGSGYIYVDKSMTNAFKTATNWSTYASKIRGV